MTPPPVGIKRRGTTQPAAEVAQQVTGDLLDKEVEELAEQLADRPYGEEKRRLPKPVAKTLSLPDTMIEQIEDDVRENKRRKKGPRTFSGIVRQCLAKCGYGPLL